MTSPILQFTRKEFLCAIQFTSMGRKLIRTCILPMYMNHEAIKEYFASSLYIYRKMMQNSKCRGGIYIL